MFAILAKRQKISSNNGLKPKLFWLEHQIIDSYLYLSIVIHHTSPLLHLCSNSAWLSQTCWASYPAGGEAVVHPACHPSPLLLPAHRSPSLPVLPVLCPHFPSVYPWDNPRCRFWCSPPRANPWTPTVLCRSDPSKRRPGGASTSTSSSGCCSRRSRGCCPAGASVGSKGPLARRTGSGGGCCWTSQAHGGTAGLRMQLRERRQKPEQNEIMEL